MAIYNFEHKPFVASEVGLICTTHDISASVITDTNSKTIVTENGRTVVKAGSLYSNSTLGVYGLVYNDVDITDGAKHASVMTSGHYYAANLPDSTLITSTIKGYFEKQGLFEQKFGETTRSPITNWDGANVSE